MYTTKKKTGKLINQYIFAWIIIGVAILKLAFKNYSHFDSFKALGSFIDVFILLGLGIAIVLSSDKKIKQLKGIEFDITESALVYKTLDEELIFNETSPPKSITKSLDAIVIQTSDTREIKIHLEDFSLDYEQLKDLNSRILELSQRFEKGHH
jgi:hypothetical protein